ncbi:MAG TPA: hypothetical protein VGP95_13425, partial [Gemmatimonadaceae bacterium]|nr:hypothetical protein [Gemmatimonadaceae bacterium]
MLRHAGFELRNYRQGATGCYHYRSTECLTLVSRRSGPLGRGDVAKSVREPMDRSADPRSLQQIASSFRTTFRNTARTIEGAVVAQDPRPQKQQIFYSGFLRSLSDLLIEICDG